MTRKYPSTCEERTRLFLDKERGTKNEFYHLHAILCLSHGWSYEDSQKFSELIDSMEIAKRLDEMIAEIKR